jgi:hypothetical protein
MAGNMDFIFETLEDPGIIVGGEKGEFIAMKHYNKTYISGKHIVVIY